MVRKHRVAEFETPDGRVLRRHRGYKTGRNTRVIDSQEPTTVLRSHYTTLTRWLLEDVLITAICSYQASKHDARDSRKEPVFQTLPAY